MYDYSTVKMLLGKVLIFISLILVTVLYIILGKPVALGFAAGIISMFINWRLLALQTEKVVGQRKGGGFVYMFLFLRYSIIAAIIGGAFVSEGLNGYAAISGVIFSQIYIFVFALILSRRERGNKDA